MAKILIVDDEFALRAVLVDALESEGHAVVAAHNGQVAVELAIRERPDLILMDMMMPELDGPGAVKVLRATPGLAEIPVVLMSATANADQMVPDSVGFLPKPFGLEQLFRAVEDALDDR